MVRMALISFIGSGMMRSWRSSFSLKFKRQNLVMNHHVCQPLKPEPEDVMICREGFQDCFDLWVNDKLFSIILEFIFLWRLKRFHRCLLFDWKKKRRSLPSNGG